MKYEQMITIYGTIVIEADSEDEAENKILAILQNGIELRDGELIIGDFERVSDVRKAEMEVKKIDLKKFRGRKEIEGWKLRERLEMHEDGYKIFYEEWVHYESKSGLIFLSRVKDGRLSYYLESYGIGTINPDDFTECADVAPIIPREFSSRQEAEEGLKEIIKMLMMNDMKVVA